MPHQPLLSSRESLLNHDVSENCRQESTDHGTIADPEIHGLVLGLRGIAQQLRAVIGWDADAIVSRRLCQWKWKRKLTRC